MAVPKFMRVIRKTMGAVALFAVVGITLLLGSLWLDHTRETMLTRNDRLIRSWPCDVRLERSCTIGLDGAANRAEYPGDRTRAVTEAVLSSSTLKRQS